MGGRISVESVAECPWNRWPNGRGIRRLRARRGIIVNIASTRALQSEPQCEAYAAAKGGLLALTHALAISLGPEIRVNAVSPGWIETGPGRSRAIGARPRTA
ncbi:SDR family oxidoreductase [Thiorhodococcus minor]|uniref:SDR family oxidoreductase n=1 Tax=Thiorhodococcus minor TaxID=57489 RepID=UPI003CC9187B